MSFYIFALITMRKHAVDRGHFDTCIDINVSQMCLQVKNVVPLKFYFSHYILEVKIEYQISSIFQPNSY